MFINTLKSLTNTSNFDQSSGDAGYKTEIYYKLRDCCGHVSVPISMNEQLGTQSCSLTYPDCNWTEYPLDWGPVEVGSWVGDEFADGVEFWREGTPDPFPDPDPVSPSHPQAGLLVTSGNQKWRAASTEMGDGVLVQNKALKFYRGKGRAE
jgi:hypothetical protein